MTYTEQQKQALSRKVAEKLGVEPYQMIDEPASYCFGMTERSCDFTTKIVWLHDDWHTIMELCVKYGVNVFHASSNFGGKNDLVDIMNSRLDPVYYTDCASPSEAERIARLLALSEV